MCWLWVQQHHDELMAVRANFGTKRALRLAVVTFAVPHKAAEIILRERKTSHKQQIRYYPSSKDISRM